MKKFPLILPFVFILYFLIASSALAAPALVGQARQITGSSVSSFNISTSTSAGNLLVVFVAVSDPGTRFTISSPGLNFQEDVYHTGGGSPYIEDSISIWSAPNVSAGSHTINVKLTDPDYVRWGVAEFSGIATSNHVIDTATAWGFTSTINSGTITTTQNSTLLFAGVRTDGDETAHGTISAGSNFTLVWPWEA